LAALVLLKFKRCGGQTADAGLIYWRADPGDNRQQFAPLSQRLDYRAKRRFRLTPGDQILTDIADRVTFRESPLAVSASCSRDAAAANVRQQCVDFGSVLCCRTLWARGHERREPGLHLARLGNVNGSL
jgi:hypothetical protein